jgi:hypothetical protein
MSKVGMSDAELIKMDYADRRELVVAKLREAEHLARTLLKGDQQGACLSCIDNALCALGEEPIIDALTGELLPEIGSATNQPAMK